ncbi:hypothetical protein HanLR1_Chr08g0280301 [Helianthus annuus]|nr:hypothetical protein HanLR1_Chr08g0280301 [Helianthus annuus]
MLSKKNLLCFTHVPNTNIASSFFFPKKPHQLFFLPPTPFLFSLSTLNSCFLAFPNRKSSEFAPRFHRARTLLFNR